MLLQLVDTIIAQRLYIVDGNIATILAIVLVPVVLIGLSQEKAVASLLEAEIIACSSLTIDVRNTDQAMFYTPKETTIGVVACMPCCQCINALKMPVTIKITITTCLEGTVG